jgi:hypothetical protein
MGRRFDWERLRFIGRLKLNVGDEEEWLNNDRASRWLEYAEKEKAKRMRRRVTQKKYRAKKRNRSQS